MVWHFGVFGNCIKKYGLFSVAVLSKICSYLIFVMYYYLGLPVFELYMCVHLAMAFGSALFHLQHSVNLPYREHKEKWDYNRAALEGSTFLDVPQVLRVFTNGIEYHHIHHLNTNVASYVIQECHDKFNEKKGLNWGNFHINEVGIGLSFKSMVNVMLDEETGALVPFSYSHL